MRRAKDRTKVAMIRLRDELSDVAVVGMFVEVREGEYDGATYELIEQVDDGTWKVRKVVT
jgi:hypothetical protein